MALESFFVPDEFCCLRERLPSHIYNLAHVLLNRSTLDHLFIPIRTMQYLAIIEQDAIWFADSMDYAVQDGEGGRLITVSWHPLLDSSQRDGLNQPMDCRVMFYGADMAEINNRLHGEFHQAMKEIDQRYRDSMPGNGEAIILPLRVPGSRE
jgi:hypothetical protein